MTNPFDEKTPQTQQTQAQEEDGELEAISRSLEATAPKDLMKLHARDALWERLVRLLRKPWDTQQREADHP